MALLKWAPLNEPTPLRGPFEVGRHRHVFVKDESVHPTGTFKDRLAAAVVASRPDDALFGSISYGNTALSFARALSDVPGAAFVAFFPVGFRSWTFGPSTSGCTVTGREIECAVLASDGHVLEVDLTEQLLGDDELAALAAREQLRGHRNFVNVTEGLDEPAYSAIATEALEQLGEAPVACVVPFGAGILANEVRDAMARLSPGTTVVPISSPHAHSLARMLYGPAWLDVAALSRDGVSMSRHRSPDRTGARREPYRVFAVNDEHVRRGLAIATSCRLSAEPSGAAGLGFLDEIEAVVPGYEPSRDRVLVINTGNGIDPLRNAQFGDSPCMSMQ